MPLVHLARAPVPMRQKDLAAALFLDGSSIVRILHNLEAAGLIARQEDPDDRRAKAVVVTAKGRDLARRIEQISRDKETELLAGISNEDVATVRRVLAQICAQLDSANDGSDCR